MSRNDLKSGKGRIAQEAIFASRTAQRSLACPECGKPTDVYPLRSFRGCTGRACTARQSCGWEGEPLATLDTEGRMVFATADGKPTSQPIMRMETVAP